MDTNKQISNRIRVALLGISTILFLPFMAGAATIENLQLTQSAKRIEIRGACDGRQVAVHIFSASAGEPFYTAGAECKNGSFNFQDDLGYWKIGTGQYRVVAYDENSPRTNPSRDEVFSIENSAGEEENPKSEILNSKQITIDQIPNHKQEDAANLAETNEVVPETVDSTSLPQDESSDDGMLQQMWKAFQNMGEIVKSALASLGLFIENGVARVQELIAGKIVADEASIKNLNVSEEIKIRDRLTGESYCTWIENGEWRKERCDNNLPNDANTEPIDTDNQPIGTNDNPLNDTSQPVEETPEVEPPVVELPATESTTVEPAAEPSAVEPPEEIQITKVPEVEPPIVEIPAVEAPVQTEQNNADIEQNDAQPSAQE